MRLRSVSASRFAAVPFAVPFAVALLSLSLSQRARANPADTYGLGSRSIALGGAVSSNVSDFSANYYNPAGLVAGQRLNLSAGFQAVDPHLTLDGQPSPAGPFRALVLGLAAPGHVLDVPVAFGAALQLSGDRLSRIATFAEEDQRWVLHEDRPEQIFIAASAAVRPVPWLSLGAGLAFLASTDGVLSIRGRATQPGFSGQTEYDSELSHEVIAELRSERYPLFGATVTPWEDWALAVVYRGESKVVLDVDAEFDGAVALGPLDLPTYYLLASTTVQSFVPRQVVLGVSYSGIARVQLGMDVQWSDWSAYTSPLSATASELEVEGDGLLLTLPELPAPTRLQSAQLQDRFVPRVGAEYALPLSAQWTLPFRAGYAFEATPLSGGSSPNLVDADRHLLSLGLGASGPGPAPLLGALQLDLHLQWSLFAERRAPGPDGETHRAAGSVLTTGATLSVEF